MTVTLMRHPEVEPAQGLCLGHTDIDISAAGFASLDALAEGALRLRPSRVLSSDLLRCRRLAGRIAERLNLQVGVDPVWRELNFGSWENRWWTEIRSSEGPVFEAWAENFVETAPPGGESFRQLQDRIVAALRSIEFRAEENLLIVTHAGVIRAAVCAFSGRLLHRAFEYAVPCGGRITLALEGGSWSFSPGAADFVVV